MPTKVKRFYKGAFIEQRRHSPVDAHVTATVNKSSSTAVSKTDIAPVVERKRNQDIYVKQRYYYAPNQDVNQKEAYEIEYVYQPEITVYTSRALTDYGKAYMAMLKAMFESLFYDEE
jgi:hypothetical protein